MKPRPRLWHLPVLLAAAAAAAGAALAATRSKDLEGARSRRETAERLLAKMDRRISELAEEERKFEAEIVLVEDRYRREAVDRAGLRKAFEAAFNIKRTEVEIGRLTTDLELGHKAIEWKGHLAAEILSMEWEIEALQGECARIAEKLEALKAERAAASPERHAALDAEIEAARRELAAGEGVVIEASADLEISRKVLTNK